jgi:hypothetical protein
MVMKNVAKIINAVWIGAVLIALIWLWRDFEEAKLLFSLVGLVYVLASVVSTLSRNPLGTKPWDIR